MFILFIIGSELRPSDYRFPDTSRSATEHTSKQHSLYHNNPYTNNAPFVRNKRPHNVYGSKNKTKKPSAPVKTHNVNNTRPKVVKYKQKSDWMAVSCSFIILVYLLCRYYTRYVCNVCV